MTYKPLYVKAGILRPALLFLSVILIKRPHLYLHRLGDPCKGFLVNLSHVLNNPAIVKGSHLFTEGYAVLFQSLCPVCRYEYMSGEVFLFKDFGGERDYRDYGTVLVCHIIADTTTGRIPPCILP